MHVRRQLKRARTHTHTHTHIYTYIYIYIYIYQILSLNWQHSLQITCFNNNNRGNSRNFDTMVLNL
jgi:hypothetical protein